MPVPHLLVATLAVLWLAPGGLADRALGGAAGGPRARSVGRSGSSRVYVYKETPFLVLLLLSAMGRGAGEREEAAAVHGASPWQRLRWVVWPTVRAPLVVGSIVVAAFVLGALRGAAGGGPELPADARRPTPTRRRSGDLLAGEGVAAAALLVAAAAAIALAAAAVRFARTAEGA